LKAKLKLGYHIHRS